MATKTHLLKGYTEMIYPERRLTALQLLHDEIGKMAENLERWCEKSRIPSDGTLEEIVADIIAASETPINPTVIEDILQTDWLNPSLLEARWNGESDLAINTIGLRSEVWKIRADERLLDSLLNDESDLANTLWLIEEDSRIDAPLRIVPELPRLRAVSTFLFDAIEQEHEMHEIDRLTMLVMLMRSGTIKLKDFASLKDETNEKLFSRLSLIYEVSNNETYPKQKAGKRYAFMPDKKPDFLSDLITVLPGIKDFYLQDEGENETYNVKFDHNIVMGGDQISIPDNMLEAAWEGLEGRPVTDLIDTPLTQALNAEIVSVKRWEGTGQITVYMNQRMKEKPISWTEDK